MKIKKFFLAIFFLFWTISCIPIGSAAESYVGVSVEDTFEYTIDYVDSDRFTLNGTIITINIIDIEVKTTNTIVNYNYTTNNETFAEDVGFDDWIGTDTVYSDSSKYNDEEIGEISTNRLMSDGGFIINKNAEQKTFENSLDYFNTSLVVYDSNGVLEKLEGIDENEEVFMYRVVKEFSIPGFPLLLSGMLCVASILPIGVKLTQKKE